MNLNYKLKAGIKTVLAPLLFRGYPITLAAERLYLWMDILCKTLDVEGDVVEVGVMHGGTAILAKKLLKRLGSEKNSYAYDTFEGFVEKQVEEELKRGLNIRFRNH